MKLRRHRETQRARKVVDYSGKAVDYSGPTFGDAWLHTSAGDPTGIPAVAGIIDLIANTCSLVEFRVVDDAGLPVRDSALAALLARPHSAQGGVWRWRADLAMSLAAYDEALIHVLRIGAKVIGLRVVPILSALPLLVDGNVCWQDTSRSRPILIQAQDAIFVRCATTRRANPGLNGLIRGASRMDALREIGAAELARLEHQRGHAETGMAPAFGYQFPPGVSPEQADEWVTRTENRNRGRSRWGRIVAAGGGSEIVAIPSTTARDAQQAEMTELTVAQAAWRWNIPPSIAGVRGAQVDTTGGDWRRFVTVCVAPPMTAVASEIENRIAKPGEHIRVSTEGLMLYDPLVMAQVRHQYIQSGLELPDEIRGEMGLRPLPPYPADPSATPGSVPQITPVGGGANDAALFSPGATKPVEGKP